MDITPEKYNVYQKSKIEGKDRTVRELLQGKKFFIDYFQREYRWEKSHITALIEDLTNAFLKCYNKKHKREEVEYYQNYYLGPVVFIEKDVKKSIIDGQQRITSITLLLIYLAHKQKTLTNIDKPTSINNLIFSDGFGQDSFNIVDEDREECLSELFYNGGYQAKEEDNETVKNIIERYNDIDDAFPSDDISEKVIPYFVDWLIAKVIFIEITTYSNENAYFIFETMNDRGLNLTKTEMLKGFLLSKIEDPKKRKEMDNLWKTNIEKLNAIQKSYNEQKGQRYKLNDTDFFKAWFRGKYAKTSRSNDTKTEDKDYELIGTQMHSWFRDNFKPNGKITLNSSDDFYNFLKKDFVFFIKWYINIINPDYEEVEYLYYIKYWGIAPSLQHSLLLSVINKNDKESTIKEKLNIVSKFIETFTVRRGVNYKKFAVSSIQTTFFNHIKKMRMQDGSEIKELKDYLKENSMDANDRIQWEGISNLRLHSQNGKFIKHLLSRITSYIDSIEGIGEKINNYKTYHNIIQSDKNRPFQIEHIIPDKFRDYKNDFQDNNEFQEWRNNIGGLLLLPKGTNQSYGNKPYKEKVKHYIKENNYVKTLCSSFYDNNPNFKNNESFKKLNFKPYENFGIEEMQERQELVQKICEQIWAVGF